MPPATSQALSSYAFRQVPNQASLNTPGRSRMTLAIARSSPEEAPGRIARATAIASADAARVGSVAIWAAVVGSGSSATPSTVLGRARNRSASTARPDAPGPAGAVAVALGPGLPTDPVSDVDAV